MCELLGMECNVPTDIVFSFAGLAARGGRRGPHADGWGLALYEGKAARLFLEPAAAADSPLARFVREHPIKTLLAVAHVRKRTRGPVALVSVPASRLLSLTRPHSPLNRLKSRFKSRLKPRWLSVAALAWVALSCHMA